MEIHNFLKVGTIISTRGLDGTLKIYSSSDLRKKRFKPGATVYFYDAKNQTHLPFTVISHTVSGELDLVKFQEIADINDAEQYLKWEVHVEKKQTDLPKGHYFETDLIGMMVESEEGQPIGTVQLLEEYGPYKTLRIKRLQGNDLLVPMVKFYIKKIDLETKKIIIHLIEGLL